MDMARQRSKTEKCFVTIFLKRKASFRQRNVPPNLHGNLKHYEADENLNPVENQY